MPGEVYYDSASIYIDSRSSDRAKIAAINSIIDKLLILAASAAENPSGPVIIDEYEINDGQSKIRTRYRSFDDIQKSITAFEKLKQIYVNRLNGRVMRAVDSKNMTGLL